MVLRAVARKMRECSRESDLVFRWRGDEMALLLTDTTREGVLLTAERIRSEVAKVGEVAEVPLHISIGGVLYPEHGATVGRLVSVAARSLSIAKQGGSKVQIGDAPRLTDKF